MIEVTDEMEEAFDDAAYPLGLSKPDVQLGLAAVLAIVERDYRLTCNAVIDGDGGLIGCVRDAGHDGGHRGEHPSAGVFWS